MFDLNRRPIIQRIGRRFRSNMYIPVYHTNGRSIKNMIGVVKNRLVGMGLYICEDLGKTNMFFYLIASMIYFHVNENLLVG